jgi:predicted TIM-barrel fold metal-dependent hydrolase
MPDIETVPAPAVSSPRTSLPHGACDAHSHVFGPFDRFPPLQTSVYALPDAPPPVHAAMRKTLGVTFGVLTQPAPYDNDPGAMLDAIRQSKGALKAVASTDATVSDAALQSWRDGGICGLRFVERRAPGGGRYPGSVGIEALTALAPRMRALGLHAQLWADTPDHAAKLPELLKLKIPLVLDHMACPVAARGAADSTFVAILDAMKSGQVWVKLTVCRVSPTSPDYADVRPFHDALIAACPDRLLWGSDWPYVRLQPAPDAGHMLDLFADWIGDDALAHRILVDNPAHFYGFGATA